VQNFSISKQVKKELEDFATSELILAKIGKPNSIRHLGQEEEGYTFNQGEAIAMIDLYHNSKFESGPRDALGQRKIFMNIGKFRTEVAAKQIDIDVKDFKFLPDDYADPWSAFFFQKDFREWSKESYFGEILNQLVENFPKYGSVVLKKIGKKKLQFVPLQLLKNEQSAHSLKTAAYVIEEHPEMYAWELKDMEKEGWNLEGIEIRYDQTMMVYERYGYVPLAWLNRINGRPVKEKDHQIYVDAMVICTFDTRTKDGKEREHVFFAEEIKDRPYEEEHWSKQHGRWLGVGTMEDLIENQQAKNIIVNLMRRSLHWSSKRIFQSRTASAAAKNLVKDVADGSILEIGPNGDIVEIDTTAKTGAEFQQFLNEWEKNSDQKAFTYEAATGESMPSGTPFRLGVLLSDAVQSYFKLKQEKLGLFLKRAVTEFLIPQFIKERDNKKRIIAMYSDEPGYEALKNAAMQYAQSQAAYVSLLTGQEVDASTIQEVVTPFDAVSQLFFELEEGYYKEAKYKFELDITGESMDVPRKIESLTNLFQVLSQRGDSRADKVLERILALSGEDISRFGPPKANVAQLQPPPEQAAKTTQPQPTQ
jgi:hypothetical protein